MNTLRTYLRIIILSYGNLIFASHPFPALLVLTATFFHPVVGVMGLIGNIVSNLVAKWMHANNDVWKTGIYGVSGVLIGLALGMYAEPSIRLWVFLIVGAAFSGVISVMLGNIFARFDLPIISIPFMLVIWILLLTIGIAKGDSTSFHAITFLRKIDLWLFDQLPLAVFEYIKMFGSIIFQENLLSGLLVLIAISIYSRISMLYGLWGGFLGMIIYSFIHGSLDGYHGLNFVLIALAFGGFFIVQNKHAFLFVSLAVVAVGFVDEGTVKLLKAISMNLNGEIPSLVFAFNIITIIFLLPLKLLPSSPQTFRLNAVPLYLIKSPETNLKWYRRWTGIKTRQRTILTFPFNGEWIVLQGNNGEWTHKGDGRFAWDFVVKDEKDLQAQGTGLSVTDFYAFGLPVLAPAPGTIVAVENMVVDNPPGEATTERNWGNYVIINHGFSEYSEMSHFRQGSITVLPGQVVQRGDIIGYCGNSGRSPVPHIHFQLQNTPILGSSTIPSVFAEGLISGRISTNFIPEKNDKVEALSLKSENKFNLLGKEGSQYTYNVKKGWMQFKETLRYGTDAYGTPAILSDNNLLWYLIEKPSFIEIRPDFKTIPSRLILSGFIDIVGDSLILPKFLQDGFEWDNGKVYFKNNNWFVKTEGKVLMVNQGDGIVDVTMKSDPKFYFKLESKNNRSKNFNNIL
ncbi:MAG: urea transporter [Fidelibacterota bacterium]